MKRRIITEAEAEAMCDRLVMRELATSRSYQNAENAEKQSLIEERMTERIWRNIQARYEIQ